MRPCERWQLDGSAPELYQRRLVPAMTAMWAADLVDRVAVRSGEHVLDVACGTGVVARLAAGRAGMTGRIVGLDVNPGMLAVARSLPEIAGAPIDWLRASALAIPCPNATFDVALCQLGLQFFPDRPSALREIGRVLVAGGRVGLNVFGPMEHNPATDALVVALDRHLGLGASVAKRTEHALADIQALRTLVIAAGFHDVTVSTATKIVRFPSVSDYVQVQLTATPLASLIAQHATARKQRIYEALERDIGAALERYLEREGLAFPQEVHVVIATR